MTQKTKNIALVCGFILLVIIAYKFAFSNTLETKQEYKALKNEAVAFDNLPMQLSSLKQKEKYYDSLLTKYQLKDNSVQNSILKTINTYADSTGLKVSNFIEPHQIKQGDLSVNTYQFTLEGHYNAIITLIHRLEQNTKFGEIINLDFQKKKNYKSGKHYLQAHVLLKSFG
ncbi:type 4a pilus biogenesis protein PilO [uncultured Psychroserpens sp.]|uniref:type 4a pilus biogenesis protein PilO n=1 Tax=uncultured Psychroserpens sp. TaxID=255436 RepID=UPI00261F69D9|nr:type 4a pilus biogenesis protein PilO [uncultured Psychroserpens sp.]